MRNDHPPVPPDRTPPAPVEEPPDRPHGEPDAPVRPYAADKAVTIPTDAHAFDPCCSANFVVVLLRAKIR